MNNQIQYEKEEIKFDKLVPHILNIGKGKLYIAHQNSKFDKGMNELGMNELKSIFGGQFLL